jgi:hypothetical protein
MITSIALKLQLYEQKCTNKLEAKIAFSNIQMLLNALLKYLPNKKAAGNPAAFLLVPFIY